MSLAARPALSPALENAAQGGNMSSPVPQHAKVRFFFETPGRESARFPWQDAHCPRIFLESGFAELCGFCLLTF
jgi:hypothetical protein